MDNEVSASPLRFGVGRTRVMTPGQCFSKSATDQFALAERVTPDRDPSSCAFLDYYEMIAAVLVGQDDVLEIEVFEIPELGITARVAGSGYVSLPLIGPVKVPGLTTQELTTQIGESFRENYVRDPHVTVLVREYASQPVSILGAV